MEKKEKILIITNIITAILVIALGGFIIFDKVIKSNEETPETDKTTVTEKAEDITILEIEANHQKVVYTVDKRIIASSPALENAVVERDVIKYYQVHAGQSDICNGNEWFILEKSDHTITAFSSDDFVCGDEITTKDITEELKKLSIETLKNVYETKELVNEYEPFNYQVLAVNQDDELVDISSLFE